jgi:hypothetical protein
MSIAGFQIIGLRLGLRREEGEGYVNIFNKCRIQVGYEAIHRLYVNNDI